MFYSQFGEDAILSNYFNNDYKGVCVEVGAYDGISGSNTYHFEQKNWQTLCIEPIPEAFNKCKLIRKNSINCCVSDYEKNDIEFNIIRLHGNNTSAISSLKVDERLIESHKNIIDHIEKINVNVKTLNTIFKETNFPKNIDFISIDTENTELDVLKGLDFNEYNIKFLIIENNFDEPYIEDYLKQNNFKKFLRNAVNDIYVNNNYIKMRIFNQFEIVNANYYINEDNNNGNVTDIIKILFKKFELSNFNINENVKVDDSIFKDSYYGQLKNLYITIEDKITNEKHKFVCFQNELLYFNKIYDFLNSIKSNKNYIETSFGEIVDKYSILELKIKYITDPNKILDIKNEIEILKPFTNKKNKYFYKLLLHINELIWLDTEIIKNLSLNREDNHALLLFAETSNRIFENNQKRFRLKKYFNELNNSNIKEHKSYKNDICYIEIDEKEEIYNKIPEINSICISHDTIHIDNKYEHIINKIFKNTNIYFVETNEIISTKSISLKKTFLIDKMLKEIYDFEPIKYISGGLFGDFFNQLSVVSEKFYQSGRKGILYISNKGDTFKNKLENTYNDTYQAISKEKYIKEYKIFNNENFDLDLTSWRINLDYNKNWKEIYSNNYQINWAENKWLNSDSSPHWENKIIINTSYYLHYSNITIQKLKNIINENNEDCVFISYDEKSYQHFVNITNCKITHYEPFNFNELLIILNSCKFFYGGFSGISVIANALHKPHILLGSTADYGRYMLNNIKTIIPHVLDIYV